jgi:hypothetical protein
MKYISVILFLLVIQSCVAQREVNFKWNINNTTELYYQYKHEAIGIDKKVGSRLLDTTYYGQEAVLKITHDSIDFARVYLVDGDAYWTDGVERGEFPLGYEDTWTTMDMNGDLAEEFWSILVHPLLISPDKPLKKGDSIQVNFKSKYLSCIDTVYLKGFTTFNYQNDTLYKNRNCAELKGEINILPGKLLNICNSIRSLNMKGNFTAYFDKESGCYVDIKYFIEMEDYYLPWVVDHEKGKSPGVISFYNRVFTFSLISGRYSRDKSE